MRAPDGQSDTIHGKMRILLRMSEKLKILKEERPNMMNSNYPFQPGPLPYPKNALEPYLDAQTVALHYEMHFLPCVNTLNRTLRGYPSYQNWSIARLVRGNRQLPFQIQTLIWHSAGGAFNHSVYFHSMARPGSKETRLSEDSRLYAAIIDRYGSVRSCLARIKECAVAQYGSGWCWLVSDRRGMLKIISTSNQDTPLLFGFCPLIALDVWEHAYYLKYQSRRGEYVDSFFQVLNWKAAESSYQFRLTNFREKKSQMLSDKAESEISI